MLDHAPYIFQLLWAIIAVPLGLAMLLWPSSFMRRNANAFRTLFAATGLRIFEVQSQQVMRPYMRLIIPAIGVMLIATALRLYS